jgi:hypothetical protein
MFWLMPALMFVSAVFIWGNSRYRLPIDPFLLILAAASIDRLIDLAGFREPLRETAESN